MYYGKETDELKKARETALTLLDMGMPAEQIAKAVNLSIETVQNWIAETNSRSIDLVRRKKKKYDIPSAL